MSLRDEYAIDRTHKAIVNNDEFQHHGIMGQRWGVITRNVGVNYIPIGRNSRSSNAPSKQPTKSSPSNKLTVGDQALKLMMARYYLPFDVIRAATGNYQKTRIPSPINEEGLHKDRLLTKAGYVKQKVQGGLYDAFLAYAAARYGSGMINDLKNARLAKEFGWDYISKELTKSGIAGGLITGFMGAFIGMKIYDTGNKYYQYTKDDKRRNTLEVDENTGLHLRNDKNSDVDDLTNVNPGYRKFTGDSNCPGCAVATELRARGYDVRAKDFSGIMLRNSITNAFEGKNNLTTAHSDKIMSNSYYNAKIGKNYDCAKDTLKALSSQPNGSRGILMIEYGRAGGHVTTYRVENGKAKIYEGQLGKVLSSAEANRLLSSCYQTSYFRTDNLNPNFDVCKEVVK